VVSHGKGGIGAAHRSLCHAQTLERLRTRHFMDEMAVDIKQAGAVITLVDEMAFPDFVV
jgi:hypothetical protein